MMPDYSYPEDEKDSKKVESSSERTIRYHKLQNLYIKWNDGLFGSRKYYQNRLKEYLNNLFKKEIQTGFSYILLSPEGAVDKKVHCKVQFGRWLQIYGELDVNSVNKVIGKNKDILRKWWRTNMLVSISGKVRKYRLDKDPFGDVIKLYLFNIKMHYDKKNDLE